ncbi:hypothetical protein [Streptomyces sp. NPDC102360]|uniref:hypothetical protein n=1 Tax=Streptomyces sp. NPDC102360 TaxID=3366160 RepID=UPI0038191C7B
MTNNPPRPPLRMCARCQRTTDEPILVQEVHAPTGPGFNVYACPECAPSYPPMVDPLDILDRAHRVRRDVDQSIDTGSDSTP